MQMSGSAWLTYVIPSQLNAFFSGFHSIQTPDKTAVKYARKKSVDCEIEIPKITQRGMEPRVFTSCIPLS